VTVSRADFLKLCGLALVGAGVDVPALQALVSSPTVESVQAPPFSVHAATAAHFRQHLNTPFELSSPDGTRLRLFLAAVTERPASKRVEQFSLIFYAPSGCTVADGLHAIRHQALGAFELFIVPVGAPNGRRTVYQACFSRLRT
jgi:hypothetical protein